MKSKIKVLIKIQIKFKINRFNNTAKLLAKIIVVNNILKNQVMILDL